MSNGEDMKADTEMNKHMEESLTFWGDTLSAQVRDTRRWVNFPESFDTEPAPTVVLHHYEGSPRSTEDGQPYEIPVADAVLLRDVLNAATKRGILP